MSETRCCCTNMVNQRWWFCSSYLYKTDLQRVILKMILKMIPKVIPKMPLKMLLKMALKVAPKVALKKKILING